MGLCVSNYGLCHPKQKFYQRPSNRCKRSPPFINPSSALIEMKRHDKHHHSRHYHGRHYDNGFICDFGHYDDF